MKQYKFFTGLFFLEWIFFLIIYPVWFYTVNFSELFIQFSLLLLYILINIIFVNSIFKNNLRDQEVVFSFRRILGKNNSFIKNIFSEKDSILIIVFSVPAIILHLYAASFPIQTGGDEAWHVIRGMLLFEAFSSMIAMFSTFFNNVFIIILIVLLIIVFLSRTNKMFDVFLKIDNRYLVFFSILLSFIYFYAILAVAPLLFSETELFLGHQTLIRHNPLGAVIISLELTIFGFNEIAVRLHSIIFTLLTSYFVYRVTRLYRTKKTALLAGLITLYIPIIFYFGNVAYLDSGVTFFFTTASFYYLRYFKNRNFNDLILTGFIASLGFLYKDIMIIFLAVIGLFFISNIRKHLDLKIDLKNHFYLMWIILIVALPWTIYMSLFREFKYEFIFTNILNPEVLIHWIRLLPSLITEPLFILFVLGFFYLIFKKKDSLSYFLLIWFLVFYLFPLMENIAFTKILESRWNFLNSGAGGRAILPLMPVVAIIIAIFVEDFRKKTNIRFTYVSTIFFLYLSLFTFNFTQDSLTWKSNGSYLTPKYYSSTITPYHSYLPYDDIFFYFQQNIGSDAKIVTPISNEPSGFYLKKYDLNNRILLEKINLKTSEYATDFLFDYCINNNVGYALLFEWQVSNRETNEDLLKNIQYEYDKFRLQKEFHYKNGSVYLYNCGNFN